MPWLLSTIQFGAWKNQRHSLWSNNSIFMGLHSRYSHSMQKFVDLQNFNVILYCYSMPYSSFIRWFRPFVKDLFPNVCIFLVYFAGINRFDINETINEIHCTKINIIRMMQIMRQTVVICSKCILIMLLNRIINKCHYFMMQWLLL